MKKLFLGLILISSTALMVSCGSSSNKNSEEIITDSMMQSDRNEALENANQLLGSDSASIHSDTIRK